MDILIADDDDDIAAIVEYLLAQAGHQVCVTGDGNEALKLFESWRPDLVILDISMPGMNGYDVCAAIRESDALTPVIMLTARTDIVDKSIGFRTGADDYIIKPFIADELLLRIEAQLRRRKAITDASEPEQISYEGLTIDIKHRSAKRNDIDIELTPKEFHLLRLLATNQGTVFTREQLAEELWGRHYTGEIANVAVLVHRLREKIEPDLTNPLYIRTIWHVGYCFGK